MHAQQQMQDLSRGRGEDMDMASARSANLNGGLGKEPPSGVQGRAPGMGTKPHEAESFLPFSYKKCMAKS